MTDDNKKPKTKEEIHEQNRKIVRSYMGVPSQKSMETKGIKLIDKPIRPGASADSSGYFAKAWHAAKKERSDWHNNRKGYTMPEIEKMEAKSGDVMNYFHEKVDKAKEDYHRQKNKMAKGLLYDYDKDGHPISPFSSKKEMKPAKIVSPVKRPSEAVMKKLTGNK